MIQARHVASRSLLVLAVMGLGPQRGQAATASQTLARICDEYWEGTLKASPTTATSIAHHRYDAVLEDISPAGLERERARLEGVLAEVSGVDEGSLSSADRVTRSALILELKNGIDGIGCHFEDWVVDPLGG